MAIPLPDNVLTISDFSPGIFSSLASNYPAAPVGAANEDGTVGCIALPGGGLGPLPRANTQSAAPAAWHATAGVGPMVAIAGIGRSYGVNGHIILCSISANKYYSYNYDVSPMTIEQWEDADGVLYSYATSFLPSTGGGTPTGLDINYGYSNDPTAVPYVGSHILHGRANLPHSSGRLSQYFEFDVIGLKWRAKFTGTWPSYVAAQGVGGQAFLHQQRNNLLTGVPDAGIILYTTSVVSLQGALYLYGTVSGDTYGVISTGEFIIITKSRGALRITGSFEFPTLIELPGVVSTGEQSMRGVPTSIGLLYCVDKVGVFVWNGSNTSKFVSPQLDPTFYERTTDTYDSSGGQSVQATKWGSQAVFPNNWLFDPDLNSWWRLPDLLYGVATPCSIFWYGENDELLGAPDVLTVNVAGVYRWDRDDLVPYWTWQSHPIHVSPHGRLAEVFDVEIVVVAPTPGVDYQVSVHLTSESGGSTELFEFNGDNQIPIRLRKTTSCRGYDVTCKVTASCLTTNLPAPILHSISLGWRDAGANSAVVPA